MPRKTKEQMYIESAKKSEKLNPNYKYYNANPQGEFIGDCVVRALTVATGRKYEDVDKELCEYVCEVGYGRRSEAWEKFVEKYGEKITLPKVTKGCTKPTPLDYCGEDRLGVYVFLVKVGNTTHLTTVVDGKLYDTWDCSGKSIYRAWKFPDC